MRLSLIAACFGLLVWGCATGTMRSPLALYQGRPKMDTHVIDSVPDPNDEEIRKIRTADEWHNPYVMVGRDGYELILHGQPRTGTRLSLDELENRLLKMPLERWPLGRVVAVQEIAIRSNGDDEKIAENVKALKRMLGSHKVRADLWPTA